MIGLSPASLTSLLVLEGLNDLGNNSYSVNYPLGSNDTILSVQPDGSFQTRPKSNTPGGYETFYKNGNMLVVRPTSTTAYAFAYVELPLSSN